MASKNVEVKKKIGNQIYDLNIKSDSSIISHGDGLSVKDVLDAYTDAIDDLEDVDSGLDSRIESLETAVGGVSSGLIKDVSDLDNQINGASTGIDARVGTLEGAAVVMTGATTAANGAQGFVPAPTTGDVGKFLNGAGEWDIPPGSTYAAASTAADGLMTSTDKAKLDGIAASANNYSHPAYDSAASGLYKVAVDATGHVSSAAAVEKSDITGLGIPESDTTYADATTAAAGLMGTGDKAKLDSIAASANNYSHPNYTSKASGMYKVTVDETGHVSAAEAVEKSDITALGVPGSDTTYAAATTAADGLMTSAHAAKLDSIAASANNYSHPAHDSAASGLYKVAVDAEGHVTGATAVEASDITGLGIPASDTTYGAATSAAAGLMSSADKAKLDGIADSANNYSHPSYDSAASGLYKVAVDATGHVSNVASVEKSDITALGIPGEGSTYDAASTVADGLMSSADKTKLDGIADSANNYSHPTYTSKASGLYKVTVDGTGHVSGTDAVQASDITGLGIPASDTTYAAATTAAAGLMSADDKTKLNGIADNANNYSHPSHDSAASGLYKVTVDGEGHVTSTSAVEASDITGLGIPASDTTYGVATTAADGLMTTAQVSKLNGIAENANNYSHPTYTSKAAGLYKVTVDGSGHVSNAAAVEKSDITGLGIPESDTTYADATTAASGLMSSADKTKLNGIADNANAYSHPTYTSKAAGLYKVAVDGEGHVSGTTAVQASDITGLGIPASDTTYGAATSAAAGLMSSADKAKLDAIADSANKYEHPSYTSKASGLYKISVDGTGHVSGTTAVGDATTAAAGLMTSTDKAKLDAIADSANKYEHPTYTSKASGLYKVTVDGTGHVSGTADVQASDITGLGIPASDTTYDAATSAANGLMSSTDKVKLDSIADSANKYTHPSYTSKAAGLYKVTIDATGHVSGTTAVQASDITGLGIPSENTTYADGTTTTHGLLSVDDKKKLDSIAASANNYSHPTYTSKAAGLYKISVDGTGHVSGTTAVGDATTAAAGLMTTTQVTKLNGIADNANAYSHPTYTSKASGLYKVTIDGTGHVSGATAAASSDITALGIPSENTTYADGTTATHGLLSVADKKKLDSIAASANNYSHPTYTSKAAGLYKITVDATGHVSGTTAVSDASTAAAGLMTTAQVSKLESIATSANNYSHPSYTSKAAGLYKMTVDGTGHVSGTTAVVAGDITGLGIASTAAAATNAAGLMSADDKKKLDSIAASANKYSHPSYTSKAAGLYKITVDATGHVSGTTAVSDATTAAAGLMTTAQVSKLNGIADNANNYTHPSYTSKASGLYKITVDATGHVSATANAPNAATNAFGVMKVGTNLTVSSGVVSVSDASTAAKGVVKVGSNLTVSDGIISLTSTNVTDALGYTPIGASYDSATSAIVFG